MIMQRPHGSERGTTMAEVMVATAILSIAMACTYASIATQMRTHATQTMVSECMNETRMALRVMSDQVDMAGFGVPSATTPSTAPKLVTATASQLTYWSKLSGGHTYLVATAARNSVTITVLSAVPLTAGTAFYITDMNRWYSGSVQQVVGNTVTITPALTYDFSPGSLVTPVEQTTFQLDGDQLQRNGHTIIRNVTGLRFTYDASSVSAVRRIGITLSAQTIAVDLATGQRLAFTLTTQVAPPNLAL